MFGAERANRGRRRYRRHHIDRSRRWRCQAGCRSKVLHERPADDLGRFDVFSCCPIIEPAPLMSTGSRTEVVRVFPLEASVGRPAALENDLGAGSGNRLH